MNTATATAPHATAFIPRRERVAGQLLPVYAVMVGREIVLETFDRSEATARRDSINNA
jgi:hypothetical protein